MRRLYTALVAASMLMGGAAQAQSNNDGYRSNNTVAQIRARQREAEVRKKSERLQSVRDRQQRLEVAKRYHEQQRLKEDRQRRERLAYNRDRKARIDRIRSNQHSGRGASARSNIR